MIRYDSGTIYVSFTPLHALRNLMLVAVASVGLLYPLTENAGSDLPPQRPTWAASASVVHDVLTRRTTYPADERVRIANAVARESEAAGFDPLFVLAVIEAESGFDHSAVSGRITAAGACVANAKGFMQVVDKTWKEEIRRRGLPRLDRFDPVASVIVGVGYLAHLHAAGFRRFDSLLAAYLLGPGDARAVLRGQGAPNATSYAHAYAARVMKFYARNLTEHGVDARHAKKSFWANRVGNAS